MNETRINLTYKNTLFSFMKARKHNQNSSADEITHRAYGTVLQGNFSINKTDMKEFLNLYSLAIENNISDLTILEVQPEYSPIIIDIDLKCPADECNNNSRLYDENLIVTIIKKYILVIETYLKINKDKFYISVFEKERATDLNDIYKDGFHIIMSNAITNIEMRHLIRYKVVQLCIEEKIFESFIENADKIIDKAVVSSNGWLLYGSRKPDGYVYNLTKIYDYNFNIIYDLENLTLTKREIIDYHSLRLSNNKKRANKLLDITSSDVNAEVSTLGLNTHNILEAPTSTKIFDIELANVCIPLLSVARAKDYIDWRNVGLVLYNIDKSLLPLWREFSKKCPEKFNKTEFGGCDKMWSTFRLPADNLPVLTIRSLIYWTKIDNPKEWQAYNKAKDNSIILKCTEDTFTIAKTFNFIYKEKYVYCRGKWRYFDSDRHIWREMPEASMLKTVIPTDFVNKLWASHSELSKKMSTLNDENIEKKILEEKLMSITRIIKNLKDITYRKKIIEEAQVLFGDDEFENKLDSNVYLLGCENGIYDFQQRKLRNGLPDDYVSFNTKINYKPYSEKLPYIKKIKEFFKQIQPIESVSLYLLKVISICLLGLTNLEKFFILTGSGSNGKSLLFDLIKSSLGDYYMSCPITMITRKRGVSNETSPEKVRMKGKRCGVFQETDDGDKMNVGIMKEFTGGDTVLVRDLYKGSKEMLEYKPQMHYFLTCNVLPIIPSMDEGTWRRLVKIDFNSKFVNNPQKSNEYKINTNLKQEILLWSEDFLSYLIYIYETHCYNHNYIEEPIEISLSTNEYKNENDIYTEFTKNNLDVTTDNSILLFTEIWNLFKIWHKESYPNKGLPKKQEFDKLAPKSICDFYNKSELTKMGVKNIKIADKNEVKSDNLLDL